MEEQRTKIKGVTRDDPHTGINRQEIIRRYVHSGTRLTPKLEPDNPADPDAVALWLEMDDKQFHLGYLSREHAVSVGERLRAGQTLDVIVSEVTGGVRDKPTRGVNVVICELAASKPGLSTSRKVLIGILLAVFVICCLLPLCLGTGNIVLREIGILPTWTPVP